MLAIKVSSEFFAIDDFGKNAEAGYGNNETAVGKSPTPTPAITKVAVNRS
jgi:hypothetical protein